MATGYTTADVYRVVNSRARVSVACAIHDGGYESIVTEPRLPRKPLDSSAPETFDGWVQCADGRTIWEYANGDVR